MDKRTVFSLVLLIASLFLCVGGGPFMWIGIVVFLIAMRVGKSEDAPLSDTDYHPHDGMTDGMT